MGEIIVKPIHNVFKEYRKMNLVNPYRFGIPALPFVSTWKTDNISTGSSANNQVKLPLVSSGTYAFTVFWGDGTSSYISSWNQTETTHTYSTINTYQITIVGICRSWRFANSGDKLKILSVQSWGNLDLGNGNGYFWGCSNLELSMVSDVLNFVGTISMRNFFRDCPKLTTINKINEWNLSAVKDIAYMFYGSTAFNQNIGNWNVSAVTDMTSTFSATSFNQDIGNWNVSSVIDFTDFMNKTPATFSATNLDAIYNGWSSRSVKTPITINFGTAKYTSASSAGRAILTGAPNNWAITDGGI